MRKDLRVQRGISRGQPFQIQLNGEPLAAYPGETIATVLFAAGIHGFRHTFMYGEPRGPFCGMGLCYDCLVTVNGEANVRACHTMAQPGDRVECQIK
jgi:aerobic-type carbon monoxide dehydrogenase small subunit (CoxS/CutS family)